MITLTPPSTSRPSSNGERPHRRWTRRFARRAADHVDPVADYHAETTRAAWQARAALVRAGYHLGSVPYGYRAVEVTLPHADGVSGARRRRLVLNDKTAPTVAHAFHLRVELRLSYSAIAQALNDGDGPQPLRQGMAAQAQLMWKPTLVRSILTHPVYLGWQVWARTISGRKTKPENWVICRDAHEAIVTETVFMLAQRIRGLTPPRRDNPADITVILAPQDGEASVLAAQSP